MKQADFVIESNNHLNSDVMEMVLTGDTSDIKRPGQFVNILVDGLFLRRPISVCDCDGNKLKIIYKIVGKGTKALSEMGSNVKLNLLTGLGNGYDISKAGKKPLLIGGGVGVPPLYMLAKKLIPLAEKVTVILGFNTKNDTFYIDEFKKTGAEVAVTTVDGSYGVKGFVTDAIDFDYTHIFCCGPEAMLKAVYKKSKTDAQFSFEERMGCGFGACMGCSCKTITGFKRICKEGPVLKKEEILWDD